MGMRPQELLQNSVVFYVNRAAVPRFSSRDRESFQCTSKKQVLNQKLNKKLRPTSAGLSSELNKNQNFQILPTDLSLA